MPPCACSRADLARVVRFLLYRGTGALPLSASPLVAIETTVLDTPDHGVAQWFRKPSSTKLINYNYVHRIYKGDIGGL